MDAKLREQLIGKYCVCHNVQYDEICDIVKNANITTMDDLQNIIHCCKRCKLCKSDIENIIAYFKKSQG